MIINIVDATNLSRSLFFTTQLMELGIPVAMASDFNPGSCPSLNLQFIMNLGYLKYRLTPEEMQEVVNQLSRCENPYHCPHGRPTFIILSEKELEKEFLR